jgi:hypothetical protein
MGSDPPSSETSRPRWPYHPFGIDLLIVNVIRPDVARRPYYRGTSNNLTEAQFERVILSSSIGKLNWTGLYPELFAATIGPLLGMEPHLTLNRAARLWADRQLERFVGHCLQKKTGVSAGRRKARCLPPAPGTRVCNHRQRSGCGSGCRR